MSWNVSHNAHSISFLGTQAYLSSDGTDLLGNILWWTGLKLAYVCVCVCVWTNVDNMLLDANFWYLWLHLFVVRAFAASGHPWRFVSLKLRSAPLLLELSSYDGYFKSFALCGMKLANSCELILAILVIWRGWWPKPQPRPGQACLCRCVSQWSPLIYYYFEFVPWSGAESLPYFPETRFPLRETLRFAWVGQWRDVGFRPKTLPCVKIARRSNSVVWP